MDKIKKNILEWIESPSEYIKPPRLYSGRNLPDLAPDAYLKIKSLTCIRKNEISKDEIVILIFWLCENGDEIDVEGIIHLGHEYARVGESYDINIAIDLARNRERDTFCIMVYEEDIPWLLDPHDPIGLVTFHKNQGIALYRGDFRKVTDPLIYTYAYNKPAQLNLDAGDDGCYRLEYSLIISEEDQK